MRINSNIMAFNAYRNLNNTNMGLAKSLEKLSSGFRINRAADDASGLVISQGLRAQISGLRQATRNAQDGVSVVQTAEGALTELHAMLNRMRDLIIQSANTGSSDATARQAAQNEIVQLRAEIDRIAQTTSFGTQKLLDGSFGAQSARLAFTGFNASGGVVTSNSYSFNIVIDEGTGASLSVAVLLTAGTYATAASYETEFNRALSAAFGSAAVTADVVDLGANVWQLVLSRSATSTSGGVYVAVSSAGSASGGLSVVSARTSNPSGGTFQVGANVTTTDQIAVSIADTRITGGTVAAFTQLSSLDVTDQTKYPTWQSYVDAAISQVSTVRGQLGAVQNRFEGTISNLQVTTENLTASESRIRDTDMALEMVSFTRNQILVQAGTAMLAQANAAPQSVLQLLQG